MSEVPLYDGCIHVLSPDAVCSISLFFTLVAGARRSLSLKLSDTRVSVCCVAQGLAGIAQESGREEERGRERARERASERARERERESERASNRHRERHSERESERERKRERET